MSKIKTIQISNLKAIDSITANFDGCTAIVTGGNNKGKTTLLKTIIDRIMGLKPSIIVKSDAKEMYSELELTTGEKFIWSVNENGNEKLLFITKDQIKVPITKSICDRYFPKTFDIDKFLNETPKEQKKILQDLTGLDFSKVEAEYKEAYENRTFANRKRDEEKAKCKDVVFNPELPKVEYKEKLSEITSEIATLSFHNERYEKAENEKQSIDSEIEQLQEKLKQLQGRQKNAIEWLSDENNKPKTNKEQLEKEQAELMQKNKQIEENNKAVELIESAKIADENAKIANEKVKEIESRKLELIKSANLPDGISFTDEGIEINNLPVSREQLSSSGIYIAALKLAYMKLGEVKTLHFDASHLDKNSLSEIESWANEHDLQLLIERPDYEGGEITYELLQK